MDPRIEFKEYYDTLAGLRDRAPKAADDVLLIREISALKAKIMGMAVQDSESLLPTADLSWIMDGIEDPRLFEHWLEEHCVPLNTYGNTLRDRVVEIRKRFINESLTYHYYIMDGASLQQSMEEIYGSNSPAVSRVGFVVAFTGNSPHLPKFMIPDYTFFDATSTMIKAITLPRTGDFMAGDRLSPQRLARGISRRILELTGAQRGADKLSIST